MRNIYNNLSDFAQRTTVALNQNGRAIIIVDTIDGVRITLMGFTADPDDSDFEIKEQGYSYYLRLVETLKQLI